jgi:hypothetical protein
MVPLAVSISAPSIAAWSLWLTALSRWVDAKSN